MTYTDLPEWTQRRDMLAVCLNPALDLTVDLDRLVPGAALHYASSVLDVGGKGINVAAAIRLQGGKVRLFTLEHSETQVLFQHYIDKALRHQSYPVPGHIRINVKLHDDAPDGGVRLTELDGNGTRVSEADAEGAIKELVSLLKPGGVVILSGSLPPGMRPGLYRDLARQVRDNDGLTVLDSSGEPLMQAMAARCDILKPNRAELREVTGMPCDTIQDAAIAAGSLCRIGARLVLASLDKDGAILTDGTNSVYAPVPFSYHARSLQGAGDAMTAVLACFAAGRRQVDEALSLDELASLLAWAMAASQATVRLPGTRMADADQTAACLPDIRIEQIAP